MPDLSKNDVINYLNADYKETLSLMVEANNRKDSTVTYSKNIFLPITNICRNECGYCVYRRSPESFDAKILMEPSEVMAMLLQADKNSCHEALFTFGEGADEFSEVNYALDKQGFASMVDYLYFLCSETLDKTNLLPHSNPGILRKNELKVLREVNASMGLMLENSSSRLMQTIAHEKSPGKDPALRIKTIKNAGKLKIPFTTGLLIGVGETVEERAESILEIRKLQDKYGHIQEIIIQNFKPKPGIPMENQEEPSLMEMVKMVTVSKLLFPDVSIQVPPNLNMDSAQMFLLAGADDWGGVSTITKDYVNPEAPWPELERLKGLTQELGLKLVERLPVYSQYISDEFLSPRILEKIESIR
ncbi:MAG TPA: 7,8-didemethyl-8-hydroxy-5-deazariboflavin synthase subunit CofG [Methanobacterium sp.]|nr:7,8-didemethyl-8-hydroxy-5-deazariboflavin synthase subunit CofG [Methanobacterium sp.]